MTIDITDHNEILSALPLGASLDIYTDGASKNNPGPAGWGLVVTHEGQQIYSASAPLGTATNVVAEMMAALKALLLVAMRPDLNVTIICDNEMLKRGMTEWVAGWKRKGWRKADGKPVANLELWKQLDALASTLPLLKWQWVRGHDGNEFNEVADSLASDAAERSREVA
jgi:ribonuclease HI